VLVCLLAAGCTGKSTTAPSTPPAQPLSLSCPAAIETASQTGLPLQIRYSSATAVGGSAPVQVSCKPDNDSYFQTGTTTVTCTGTDAKGVSASCSFNIKIIAPGRISLTNFSAFGDSMTAGEVVTDNGSGYKTLRLDPAKAYPYQLLQLLNARYGAQAINVSNLGKYGETTPEGAARLPGALTTSSQVLMLMEGANDFGANPPISMTASISNMRTMIQTGKSRGQRVFLATLPPQSFVSNGCPARNGAIGQVPTYNSLIRSLASSEGVTLVDIYSALITNTTLYIDCDGLHPSAAGYQKMAETFFATIRERLELPAAATSFGRSLSRRGAR